MIAPPVPVAALSALLAILTGCSVPNCVEHDAALATQAFQACTLKGRFSPQECAVAAERVSCKRRVER